MIREKMKEMAQKILTSIVKNDLTWWVVDHCIVKPSEVFKAYRNGWLDNSIRNRVSEDGVISGVFQHLRYPSTQSFGSALWPKLIGVYESELSGVMKSILKRRYKYSLDVGCAEGYYAVGLAVHGQVDQIMAYDISEKAQALCKEMAKENKVENKVTVLGDCGAEMLANFDFGQRSLIICDCEGYEKELFTIQNIYNLANCDILVEVHDFVDKEISHRLRQLFSMSHSVQCIKSISDSEKALKYKIPDIRESNYEIKYRLFREGRPEIMEWFFFEPKTVQQGREDNS
jgi:hypothetical protein